MVSGHPAIGTIGLTEPKAKKELIKENIEIKPLLVLQFDLYGKVKIGNSSFSCSSQSWAVTSSSANGEDSAFLKNLHAYSGLGEHASVGCVQTLLSH